MSSLIGRRAVVVGGGIGGLSVAGVLAGCFEQVDVLERDRLTARAESRPGTAQDRHPHGLLAGGLQALGEIFPGESRHRAAAKTLPNDPVCEPRQLSDELPSFLMRPGN